MQTSCPRCGTVNRAAARFCSQCGTALLAPPPVAVPPAPVPSRPETPRAPFSPPGRTVIFAAAAFAGLVLCLIFGFGAFAYYQSYAATPTPAPNIQTFAAPIESQIPLIQTEIPKMITGMPGMQTIVPQIQTVIPLPTELQGLPGLEELPGLIGLGTPTPQDTGTLAPPR